MLTTPTTLDKIVQFRRRELNDFARAYYGASMLAAISRELGMTSEVLNTLLRRRHNTVGPNILRLEGFLRSVGFVSSLDRPRFSKLKVSRAKPSLARPTCFRQRRHLDPPTLPSSDVVVIPDTKEDRDRAKRLATWEQKYGGQDA